MAKKTKEEAAATYALILDAAEQVFSEKGVSGTTLCNIAEAAGVTRGAIYGHFKNKTDLLNQMHERVHLPMESLAEEVASSEEPDPLGRLRGLLLKILRETAESPRQRRVLEILLNKCELIPEMDPVVQRLQRLNRNAVSRTERALGHAVARGQLPEGLDCHRAAVGLHGYMIGLISNWLLTPEGFDLGREAEALVDTYLAGLEKGPLVQSGKGASS
ncbi:TetR family transcriptional regulator [Thiohalorhabdus sp. Cl-TMA]|uniref:TetR family transcriptional regulator n=1 Tax=Thiohalorhabdus methylotrophus TaxID=3242694 RepID=A0ABV4TU94_9GAMM